MVDSVKELTRISQELKQKTEKVNKVINEIDDQLAELELGKEVWLQSSPLEAFIVDKGSHQEHVRLLGYYRFKNGWHLAVCSGCLKPLTDNQREVLGTLAHVGRGMYSRKNLYFEPFEGCTEPLVGASREIRVKALKLIPALLDLINVQAQDLVSLMDRLGEGAANGKRHQ